ncbi:50S ribosomal protein L14 [Candidatus Nomurabacteria bacterium]|nr:50S ribosomal protein L14 [Candidatus Nomurabacteria bacterium]
MLQAESVVKITDNAGGKIGKIFKVIGGSKRRYAGIGDVVIISIKSAEPRKAVKKKDICEALIVRTKEAMRRKDGSYIRFDDNAVVILEKAKKEPRAGRIFGPIPREIGELGYQKIVSLAPEVL